MFMKLFRLLALFFLMFSTVFFTANEAYAKRFGGGKSVGMQRSVTQRQHTSYANQHANSPVNSAQSSSSRFGKWGAALAGLAAGGLLSYLLMGHGLGSSILSWLAIAMVGLLIVQFFRQRRMQPAAGLHEQKPLSFFDSAPNANPQPIETPYHGGTNYAANNPLQTQAIPGFNEERFLREVKATFYRLQAAYDQKNLADIREFTMPEVFAEIQLQLNERGSADNYTEVLSLQAELLEAINEFQVPIASVRFAGQLKEGKDMQPIAFDEVWHFRGDVHGNWKIAGIQQ